MGNQTPNAIHIENVADLKAFLSVLPDDMPTFNAWGEPITIRIYDSECCGEKCLEVE